MAKKRTHAVWGTGPGSLSPLFVGSKTGCLYFLAYILREEPDKTFRIGPYTK